MQGDQKGDIVTGGFIRRLNTNLSRQGLLSSTGELQTAIREYKPNPREPSEAGRSIAFYDGWHNPHYEEPIG